MKHSMEIDGRTRTWLETPAPETPAPANQAETILFLHGSRQSGSVARNFTDRQFEQLGRVIYPDGVGRHFNDMRVGFRESARTLGIDDVAFLSALLEPHPRAIGCGFSNGGQMLIRMLFDARYQFRAVALFGAPLPTDDNLIQPQGEYTPTPILSVQGTADPLVPYEGGESGIGNDNRGTARSAQNSAETFAQLNGCDDYTDSHSAEDHGGYRVQTWHGANPVRLVTVYKMGHMVPVGKQLDPRLGPGTTATTGAELLTQFLDDAAARTR
ncbi:hypothetical protein M5J20_10955 [Corynebacterium sp. TA-R-1]|uniref:Polyhydroxybutyrate depolymerase n=1 Tax=Corynebacterium stercoris TaxID=2943490 RepID=A0ABT1G6J5_9CORY|nr:hypothetical protein [Corynebacterium stercoris]MCP1388693.1 hypothetical protein [Corynebacterium stercoris]